MTGRDDFAGGRQKMLKKMIKLIAAGNIAAVLILSLISPAISAEPYKVLVVMSYEEENPWVREIKTGIEGALGDTSDVS